MSARTRDGDLREGGFLFLHTDSMVDKYRNKVSIGSGVKVRANLYICLTRTAGDNIFSAKTSFTPSFFASGELFHDRLDHRWT